MTVTRTTRSSIVKKRMRKRKRMMERRRRKKVTNKEFKEINFIYFKVIFLLILIQTPINEILTKEAIKLIQMDF